jgi:hypothetical protein
MSLEVTRRHDTRDDRHLPESITAECARMPDWRETRLNWSLVDRKQLVAPRVNHCDLRGLEWATVIGPAERCRSSVLVLDEGDDARRQVVDRVELAATQPP